eukprot:g50620.t1
MDVELAWTAGTSCNAFMAGTAHSDVDYLIRSISDAIIRYQDQDHTTVTMDQVLKYQRMWKEVVDCPAFVRSPLTATTIREEFIRLYKAHKFEQFGRLNRHQLTRVTTRFRDFDGKSRVSVFQFDVKQMFTWLSHESVIHSVLFALTAMKVFTRDNKRSATFCDVFQVSKQAWMGADNKLRKVSDADAAADAPGHLALPRTIQGFHMNTTASHGGTSSPADEA